MTQTLLDFDAPRSRTTDPVSSRMAGADLEAAGVLSAQRRQVLSALKVHGPSTTAELGMRASLERHMVGRRMKELETLGLVVRGAVRPSAVGRNAEEWKAK